MRIEARVDDLDHRNAEALVGDADAEPRLQALRALKRIDTDLLAQVDLTALSQASAERMDRARRNKNTVSCLRFKTVKHLFRTSCVHRFREIGFSDSRSQAGKDLASRNGFQDNPRFCFAEVWT